MSRLDASVRRVLLVKARRGILDWQPQGLETDLDTVGSPDHQAAARQVALDSITLVKDEGDLLPLASEASLLVIYPTGGAGLGQAILEYAPQAALLEVSERPTAGDLGRAKALCEGVDLVVIGTRNVTQWPEQAQLLEAVRRERPVIAVALDSPYDLLGYPEVSTYLATYGRAPVSMEVLAQVLFGTEAPRGRLPVELPGLYPAGHRWAE